jgi:arginine repressor
MEIDHINTGKVFEKMKTLINKTRVKELIHKEGIKSSAEFLAALDEFVAIQVVQAATSARLQKKKILKRKNIYNLFPVEVSVG